MTDITLAVLSWGARKTLANTLTSYDAWGLTDLVDQKLIWFNEISDADRELAEAYGYEYDGSKDNLGIAGGYKELVARATGSLFLFLENDWQLICNPVNQIREGSIMLSTRAADIVRYRNRRQPGSPLWSQQFAGNELSRPEFLLESLHWEESPDRFSIDHDGYAYHPVERLPFGWYMADSRFSAWTNNPTMFRTEFIQNMSKRFEGDVEIAFSNWWSNTLFKSAQGDGLFQHWRVG